MFAERNSNQLRSSRHRVVLVLWRKGVVQQVHDFVDLYDKVTAKIKEYVHTSPSDYLIPGFNFELMREAQRVAIVRKKRFREVPGKHYCINSTTMALTSA